MYRKLPSHTVLQCCLHGGAEIRGCRGERGVVCVCVCVCVRSHVGQARAGAAQLKPARGLDRESKHIEGGVALGCKHW